MNRLLLILFLNSYSVKAQTTYYYGLVKKIANGNVITSVSGGQFISFLSDICYESNKNGIGVGHGILKFNESYSNNNFKFYIGSSYWGDVATFKFKSDLSVLNVVLENGDVYVYKQQPVPPSVVTCSLIRKKERMSSGGRGDVSSFSTNGCVGGYVKGGGISNSIQKQSTTNFSRKQPIKQVCPLCNGQRRIVRDTNSSLYGQRDYQVKCNECGGSFMRSTGHMHVTCPQCHGKGYFTTD